MPRPYDSRKIRLSSSFSICFFPQDLQNPVIFIFYKIS